MASRDAAVGDDAALVARANDHWRRSQYSRGWAAVVDAAISQLTAKPLEAAGAPLQQQHGDELSVLSARIVQLEAALVAERKAAKAALAERDETIEQLKQALHDERLRNFPSTKGRKVAALRQELDFARDAQRLRAALAVAQTHVADGKVTVEAVEERVRQKERLLDEVLARMALSPNDGRDEFNNRARAKKHLSFKPLVIVVVLLLPPAPWSVL
jgi:hypothetical protein